MKDASKCDEHAQAQGVLSHPAYHDHLIDSVKFSDEAILKNEAAPNRISFPMKLSAMLVCLHESNDNSVVSWLPHGRAFAILDKTLFEHSVLPMFFDKQTKYASFQRQLNMYGFLRLSGSNREQSGYYHELFLRGHPSLCARIARLRDCSYSVRRKYDPLSEPDFDRMTPVAGNRRNMQSQIEFLSGIAKRASQGANQLYSSQVATVPTLGNSYSVSTPNFILTPLLGDLVVNGFAPHHNANEQQLGDVRSYLIAIPPALVSPIDIKYDQSRLVCTTSAESTVDSVPNCLPMIDLSNPCSELATRSMGQNGRMMSHAAATQERAQNEVLLDATKTWDDSYVHTADWLENLDVDTFW